MGIETLLDVAADLLADRVALGSLKQGITFAELRRLARGGATTVIESGAQHVAYLGVAGPVMPTAIFAAAYAGVPYTAINYRNSASRVHELLHRLPDPLVVVGEEFAEQISGEGFRLRRAGDWLTECAAAEEAVRNSHAEDTAVVLFTSGTTSDPKGVRLTHDNLLSYVLQTVEPCSASADEAALVTVPPYHIAGLGAALTNVFAGRRVIYLPNFSAQAWLKTIDREGVTNVMVVPTMLARIVQEFPSSGAHLMSLRSVAYGGAAVGERVLRSALNALPHVDFVNAYGLTETSSTIALLGPHDHREALASDDPVVAARLGSAGRIVPGVEVQVRDDDGNVLPPGCAGELWVRGPQVSGEYVESGTVLDADGWFPTRDRGWLDPDGYLFIEGRTDDTIIRGGENIAPAEIEHEIAKHPSVADVAVVGRSDEEWGERLVAVVVPAADSATVAAEDIRDWVRGRLRGARTPDDVVFVAELPRNELGKLVRRDVRAYLATLPDPSTAGVVT